MCPRATHEPITLIAGLVDFAIGYRSLTLLHCIHPSTLSLKGLPDDAILALLFVGFVRCHGQGS